MQGPGSANKYSVQVHEISIRKGRGYGQKDEDRVVSRVDP